MRFPSPRGRGTWREGQAVPGRARRLSDEGRAGTRPLRRQGQEPAQPGRALLHQGRRRGPAHRATWSSSSPTSISCRPRREVDALLLEARLVKDIQPRFNVELKDDKSFPLPANPHARGLPARRVHAHARGGAASSSTARSPAPRACGPAIQVLQRIFQFRTCTLDIKRGRPRWRWFRPCLLHSIRQCTAPCNFRVTQGGLPQADPRLRMVLEGKKERCSREMEQRDAGGERRRCSSRRRPGCATTSPPCKNLGLRGEVDKDVQPEVFQIEPKKGLVGLRKVLGLPQTPRTIEGIDIAHLGGDETVASLVSFIDGLPFKPGYRRYRIKTVAGRRRLRLDPRGGVAPLPPPAAASEDETVFPDILLIDGGKGQLNAALRGASHCWASSRRA